MKTPAWASRMAEAVCETPPTLTWRRGSTGSASSGRYMRTQRRLVVTAGSDRRDQRLVLLHELAHHLADTHGHGDAFWEKAWSLYKRFGLTRWALIREAPYRANATAVAAKSGVRGAVKAQASARRSRTLHRRPRGVCPMPEEMAGRQGYATPHTHYTGTIHRGRRVDGQTEDYWTEAE